MSYRNWDGEKRFDPLFLIRLVFARWLIIGAFAVAGALIALYSVATTKPTYAAYMIVGPAGPIGANSSRNNIFGSIANLTGINIGNDINPNIEKYQIMMTSTEVARIMEERFHVLRHFAPNSWNYAEKRWKRKDEMPFSFKSYVKEWLGIEHWQEPDALSLADTIQQYINFAQVRKTAFVQVSFRTDDREFGVQFLNQLHQVTSELYATRLAQQTESQISYTNKMLNTEARQDVRASQINLMEEYSNTLIMLRSGQSLLVELFQPPISPATPVWPKPSFQLLSGTTIGLLLGLIVSLLWPVTSEAKADLLGRLRRLIPLGRCP